MPLPTSPVLLANFVRRHSAPGGRGALLLPNPDDGEVVAVFGNDGYYQDERVAREVALVRRWLTAAGAREVGFGVSPDGHAWALVLQIKNRHQTPAGRAFYAELARAEVEEEVGRAWVAACGGSPAAASHRGRGPRRRAG